VQYVDDAGVTAVVCRVRANVYQYFEIQLHFEQSWRVSQVKNFPAVCGTGGLIIFLILFVIFALKLLFL
jgi:hypothetical protein